MKKTKTLDAPPKQMLCQISGKLMNDPWIDSHGYRYEGPTILEYIDRFGESPLTKEPMTRNDVSPDPSLKALINKWKPSHGISEHDSPRKKMLKLVKYSMKAVSGSSSSKKDSSSVGVPDYDAILRYRANQEGILKKQALDSQENEKALKNDQLTQPLLLSDTQQQLNNDYMSESFISDSCAEDKFGTKPMVDGSRNKSKKGVKASHPQQTTDTSEMDGSASEISYKSNAKSNRSHRSSSSQPSRSENKSKLRVVPDGSGASFQTLEGTSKIGSIEEGVGDSEYEDGNGEDWFSDEALSTWMKIKYFTTCGVWNPILSCSELFCRDRTIRPSLGELSYSIDCLVCLGLLWQLNDSLLSVAGLRLSGFLDWLESDTNVMMRFLYSSYNTIAFSVLFMIIGYQLPVFIFNTVQVDASKQTRFNMFTTYVKGMFPVLLEGFLRYAPLLWLVVLIAMLTGALSSADSIIKAEYFETCTRSTSWWTNLVFVTNFASTWTAFGRNQTLNYAESFDSNNIALDMEYADVGTCFSSLWAVSCSIQLCIIFIPIVYMYLEFPTAALNLTTVIIIMVICVRVYLSSRISSAYEFSSWVYYSPIGRADAFALGMRLFMQTHYKFVSPTENRRHANKSLGLIKLILWTFCGLTPREVSHREYQYRRRRQGYSLDSDALSETVSLLGKGSRMNKNKFTKKKKNPREILIHEDILGDSKSTRRESLRPGEDSTGGSGPDDIDDTKSIFSQITSESYKFPSSISYMARAYEEADMGDDYTDIDRSTVFSENIQLPPSWLACFKFFEVMINAVVLMFCFWWVVFSFSLDDESDGMIRPSWFILSEYQYRSLTLFITSTGAYILASVALQGNIVPLSIVMCWDGWHPVAALSTSLYLTQNLTLNLMCTLIYSSAGYEWKSTTNSEARGEYVALYCQALLLNLLIALVFAVFVEKPVTALASRFSVYPSLDRM